MTLWKFIVALLRRGAFWLVLRGPRLPGPLVPWLFGFGIGGYRCRRIR